MTVETKDLRLIKTDYGHKIKAVEARVRGLEKRLDWVEKLLWLSAGAVISWLVSIVLRNV
jgi:hypothetical protein